MYILGYHSRNMCNLYLINFFNKNRQICDKCSQQTIIIYSTQSLFRILTIMNKNILWIFSRNSLVTVFNRNLECFSYNSNFLRQHIFELFRLGNCRMIMSICTDSDNSTSCYQSRFAPVNFWSEIVAAFPNSFSLVFSVD